MSAQRNSAPTGILLFAFRAIHPDGSEHCGQVTAETMAQARSTLVAQGLLPVEVTAAEAPQRSFNRIPLRDLAIGLRLLSVLSEAGLPLDRSLAVFAQVAPGSWHARRLALIRAAAREGASLTTALRGAGVALPAHVQGMLGAAQAAGTMATVLRDAANVLDEEYRQRSSLTTALTYPALIAVVGTVAVFVLLIVVVPRFARLLGEGNPDVPPAVHALFLVANIDTRWLGLLVGGALLSGTVVVRAFASDPAFRQQVHERLLSLPVIGPLRHAIAGGRIAGALAAMLTAGVPLPSALAHCGEAGGDIALAARVRAAREQIVHGESLSRAFASANVVRPSVVQLVRAGEATGDMARLLGVAASLESEWSASRVRAIISLVEPALILLLGTLIALVAAAMLQAVYAVRPV